MSAGGWLALIGVGVLVVAIAAVAMRLRGRGRMRTLGRAAQGLARDNAELVHAAGEAELDELRRTEAAETETVLAGLSEEVNGVGGSPADVFNRRR